MALKIWCVATLDAKRRVSSRINTRTVLAETPSGPDAYDKRRADRIGNTALYHRPVEYGRDSPVKRKIGHAGKS